MASVTPPPDIAPGITRKRVRSSWRYFEPNGQRLTDDCSLDRIRKLVIPPAWTDVWISPDPDDAVQARGMDARGRKQYIYEPSWREGREQEKFARLVAFGEALPAVRAQVASDLRRRGIQSDRTIAGIVRLLDLSLIRVGNREYFKQNRSVGLTTMQRKHVSLDGSRIRFRFPGKSGKDHDITVRDNAVARLVGECIECRGPFLFVCSATEPGLPNCITSNEVNEYLRRVAGCDVTAKSFRTWGASVLALDLLGRAEPGERPTKRRTKQALQIVADRLGNTVAVCRKSYVHPAILREFGDRDANAGQIPRLRKPRQVDGLSLQEAALLGFLRSERVPPSKPRSKSRRK